MTQRKRKKPTAPGYDLKNSLVDRMNVNRLLTGEAMKRGATAIDRVVFDFVLARTLIGFGDPSAKIALSQFVNGVKTKEGDWVTAPTGLSRASVQRAIDRLIALGLIEASHATNTARRFSVPWTKLIELPATPWLRPKNKGGYSEGAPPDLGGCSEIAPPCSERAPPVLTVSTIEGTNKATSQSYPREEGPAPRAQDGTPEGERSAKGAEAPNGAAVISAAGADTADAGVVDLLAERPLKHPCPKPFDSPARAEALEEYEGVSLFAYWKERYEAFFPDVRVRRWVETKWNPEDGNYRCDKIWRRFDREIGARLDRDPVRVVSFLDAMLAGWRWFPTEFDADEYAFIEKMPKNPSINHVLKHADAFLEWDLHKLQSQHLLDELHRQFPDRAIQIAEDYHDAIAAENTEERIAA